MSTQSIKQIYLLSLNNISKAKASWYEQNASVKAYAFKQMQQRAKQGYFNCVIDLAEAEQIANNVPFETTSPSQVQDAWTMLAGIVQKSPYLSFKDGQPGVKLAIQRLSWQYALVSWLAK